MKIGAFVDHIDKPITDICSITAVCSGCYKESVHQHYMSIGAKEIYICCNCKNETIRCTNCRRMAKYLPYEDESNIPYYGCTCCSIGDWNIGWEQYEN